MKIKYEFADGTVSEVEVEESIGAVIMQRTDCGVSMIPPRMRARWLPIPPAEAGRCLFPAGAARRHPSARGSGGTISALTSRTRPRRKHI